MSSNTSGVQDEEGEYPDWIELYNRGDEPVNLGGLYLTDKLEDLTRWQLPNYEMPPDSYLIIYADSDGHQGPFHTNFKLSKDGEFLALVDTKSNLNGIIDSTTLPPLDSDQSYGRLPNGIGNFEELPFQSPSRNNENISSTQTQDDQIQLSIYPNPAGQLLNVQSSRDGIITLASTTGELFYTDQIENHTSIDISGYPPGIYIITMSFPSGESYTEKFVKH